MKFNLRFIITLVLVILIIISFVFIILECLHFNSNAGKLTFVDSAATPKDIELDKVKVDDVIKVKTLGSSPKKLVADTQYYRYGSLIIHVLAMLSGAYIVYSG